MFSPADWVAAAARRVPDREALRVSGRSLTFAELDALATALAGRLVAAGVRAGDRVAAVLPNGPTAAVLPHAALRLRATLVPMNTRLAAPEVEWQLAQCAPRVVVRDELLLPAAGGGMHGSGSVELPGTAMGDGERARLDDPLAIIYTSGTTGRPKGAVLSVGNFAASAAASAATLGVRDDDRWLAVLPLFHVGGLSIVLRTAMQCTCAVVHDRFEADAVNHAIDHEGVTMVSLVAVMLQRLLDARDERPFPRHFRCALVGGGPIPRPLLERCMRLGVPVAPTYGLTEATSQVATLVPRDFARHVGSSGRALPGTQVRIDGPDEGEILVRGPTVMAGYLNDPEATARTIRDGWLHTGDVGRLDEEGYLHVLDRRDDLILSGGENVYPAEVEDVLAAHASVAEAAVLGVPDDAWGQRVIAIVRLKEGAPPDARALALHCRERLAGYKVPREFRFRAEPLPRTASGKLQRSRIRDLL